MTKQFSQKTQEELKSYVYILIDPRDNKIFYVGKGYGNRVFSHINEAIFNPSETEKLEIIRAIKIENLKVKHFIIKHGLEENEAIIVESVLIDFLTFRDFAEVAKISNIVAGHNSFNQGIRTVNECEILYNCEELKKEDIKHKVLVININKTSDILFQHFKMVFINRHTKKIKIANGQKKYFRKNECPKRRLGMGDLFSAIGLSCAGTN